MLALRWRQTLAAACIALALSGGAIAVADAQAAPTPGVSQPGGAAPGGATPHSHHRGGMYAAAAQAIGLTPQQLHQELPGKSLAQVAEAHGKNAEDVATALKQAADTHIDQAMARVVPATKGTDGPHAHAGA